MSLPNEIDQDVVCPECERPLFMELSGEGMCENGNCERGRLYSPKTIAALRNQRTPGHTEIPTLELEALKNVTDRLKSDATPKEVWELLCAARAILARVPAKVDHVAALRDLREEWSAYLKSKHCSSPFGVERATKRVAALEAAIELFEKEGNS